MQCDNATSFLFTLLVYSLDGLLVVALLVVCTCAYITKVPRLKSFFLSEKKGFFGVFYKGNLQKFMLTSKFASQSRKCTQMAIGAFKTF